MKDLYVAKVSVVGGRNGSAKSDDGILDVEMSLPQALGGSDHRTNPEQLFAAGFAGCFISSMQAAAHSKSVSLKDVGVTAEVTLGAYDDGRYGLKAELQIKAPGASKADLEVVVAEAKRICAYSNATQGNVETRYTVSG